MTTDEHSSKKRVRRNFSCKADSKILMKARGAQIENGFLTIAPEM
jgi:hypothetical protein